MQKLVADVDRRNAEKERAVAECDFEKAARLRDQADRLKKDYEGLLRDWQENRKKAVGPLDKELVEEMIHGITGRPPEPA